MCALKNDWELRILIIGVFHPVINWCGGAEWVAINIIDTLKQHGHKVMILSDESVDQTKIMNVFRKNVTVDAQIVFPFAFFPPTDLYNIYTDALRSLVLKSKCDVIIDPYSNALLPGADVAYIHFPLLKRLPSNLRASYYFLPYHTFARRVKKLNQKVIFANSKFTAEAIEESFGVCAHVLYPPVSSFISNHSELDFDKPRNDVAVTVARISKGKNLKIIPYIAKLTDKNISFLIIGLLERESKKLLDSIRKSIKKLEVSDRVKILTNVKRDQLRTILLNSKLYLHPAINEHFGVSIAEAMASGCIPIVHDSGGPREFVPEHLRYKSIEEAAIKIEKAMSEWSPKHARKMSYITDKFSESNFSKTFMDILNTKLEF